MVGVGVGWGGPLSNPLEYGFWQLGFLHCLKPQASLGGAALCWARLFYEPFFLKSLHLPWKSLQRWGAGGTGFYSFDAPKHPTKVRRQPWTPSPPDISRRLPISERGLLSLCNASLSPTLLPGLGRSSAILPGVRLNTLGSYTSLLFLGAHLTLRRPH